MLLAALALFFVSAVGTARAAHAPSADYQVASLPIDIGHGGIRSIFTAFKTEVCLAPEQPPEFITFFCDDVPALVFSPLTTTGTSWVDASDPAFPAIADAVTNGVENDLMLMEESWPTDAISSWGISGERQLFDGQAGPTGVDLAGYTTDRIGFRVDQIAIETPGSDPNGDGIWTDFSLRGAFVFEGHIASKRACMVGGWRSLHGPGGASFRNQGQCIRLAS